MIGMAARTRTEPSPSTPPREAPPHAVESVAGLGDLAEAMLSLKTPDEVACFLRDLCTLPELEALAHRWRTVQLLAQGVPYVEIAERVPTSTATVTRVAQWLRHGTGGYHIALERTRRSRRGRT
jgi:TrpR-related protein YerC/YecD